MRDPVGYSRAMHHITSSDGTPLGVTTTGTGPVVIVVGGAMSTANDAAALADALAATGRTVVTYDRRARAASGDHSPAGSPVEPEREVDDLAAVVASVGEPAAVLGHSSGAVLALFAASRGVAFGHLFLSEPPFRFGVGEPAADLSDRILALVAAGRAADALVAFQLEGVGLPLEMVEQLRASALFDTLLPLARSTAYDAALTRDVSTPTAAMLAVGTPTTVLLGRDTFPVLDAAARRLVEMMPAELVDVPESVGHRPDPVATAQVIAQRWPG